MMSTAQQDKILSLLSKIAAIPLVFMLLLIIWEIPNPGGGLVQGYETFPFTWWLTAMLALGCWLLVICVFAKFRKDYLERKAIAEDINKPDSSHITKSD